MRTAMGSLFLPSNPAIHPSGWRKECQPRYEYSSGDCTGRVIGSAKPSILIREDPAMEHLHAIHGSYYTHCEE
jgi:hypothetical protein